MKTILFSFFLLLAANVVAQNNCDSVKDELPIDSLLFQRLLKREFTKIYAPDAKNGVGNYVSMDPNGSSVDFAFTIPLKRDIVSIKAKGGTPDGIISLFSNNKWSNNIGFEVQYNWFLTKNTRWSFVSLDAMDYLKYKNASAKGCCADENIDFKDEKTESCYKAKILENELIIAKEKRKKDSVLVHEIMLKVEDFVDGNQDSLTKYTLKLAESKLAFMADTTTIHLKQLEYKRLKCECEFLIGLCKEEITHVKLRQRRLAKRLREKELFDNLNPTGFRMSWISFGYSLSNNAFRFYDPTKPFDQQISKNNFSTHGARVQFNSYQQNQKDHSYLLSVWYEFAFADNFESLTKNEIEEITTDTSGTIVRQLIQKYSAYSGEYKKNLWSHTIGFDGYYFIPGNFIGLHFYPKQIFFQSQQDETSLGIGIITPFRKSGTEKSIVNAELFMNTPNLFKTNGVTESNYFKRSEYGLRFTAPIVFNK